MTINVLIVDSDCPEKNHLKSVLNSVSIDLELQEASSAAQALAKSQKGNFDCIFINSTLPDQDCTDLYRDLMLTVTHSPSIIFLTEHEKEQEAIEKQNILGIEFVNKKTLDKHAIHATLQYALSRQKLLTQISELQNFDILTSLNNRSAFLSGLEKTIAHSQRTDKPFAVLIFDIDHFKDINETMGHQFGDKVLKATADKLMKNIRESDYLARLGSDEFGIIAANLWDYECAASFSKRIIELFSSPLNIDHQKIYLSTSIGIAMYPFDGSAPEDLLSHVESALNKAKREGRSFYCFYDDRMNKQAHQRIQMENDLRAGLDTNQFELYYQPKVNIESQEIDGIEALIRWNHPQQGLISPNDFIPNAEKNRLIVPLGMWVLEEACKQSVAWQKMGMKPIPISVNLSTYQLDDLSFVPKVIEILNRTNMTPDLLEFEITESMLMNQMDRVSVYIKELRSIGIKFSIDDFGMGYSSLAYLKNLPVDILKIDRHFIKDLNGEKNADAELANAIIALGKVVNLKVIAEGVETIEQLQFLRDHNCDQVQGFYFSKPLPAKDFYQWYQDYNKNSFFKKQTKRPKPKSK
jgi:diguanylate cyclase (GGDEF)-like protein